jgi:uncharacterized protein YbbK (DUF523 family)
MILVSACLCGENCRYDGKNSLSPAVRDLLRRGKAIAVCPEVLGGLPVPRERCEMTRDSQGETRIVSERYNDFTAQYTLGARATLFIARANHVRTAVLKSLSPSCGFGEIYDGSFSGVRTAGHGLAALLLWQNGIRVFTEDAMPRDEEL